MKFETLALREPILRALAERNYTEMSPVQEHTIPLVLAGHDVLGCAQTGTGKTAAFALPTLEYLSQHPRPPAPNCPRALILAPTRELAVQIDASFASYGKHLPIKSTAVFGGVSTMHQIRALAAGPQVLVATPGRLLDLMQMKKVSLRNLEVFVLDEADRMLDMGFIHDVKRIIRELPPKRQNLFFSATLAPEIVSLAGTILVNPKHVEVTPAATTVERIDQQLCMVPAARKKDLLVHYVKQEANGRSLVFSGTKHGANRLVEVLGKAGIKAAAIHGNKAQTARQKALEAFRSGEIPVLVATDIAARGIDVKGISLVINYDLPKDTESYVHRIGRTARAGAEGRAIAFCSEHDRDLLRSVERLIRMKIPVLTDHPYHGEAPSAVPAEPRPQRNGPPRNSRPQQRSRPARSSGNSGFSNRSEPRAERQPESSGAVRTAAPAAAATSSRYAVAGGNPRNSGGAGFGGRRRRF